MSLKQIPDGGTVYDTFDVRFTDVSVNADEDNAIESATFLKAAENLTEIFGTADRNDYASDFVECFTDSRVFAPKLPDRIGSILDIVKKDMKGNVDKIRERMNAHEEESKTIQDLVSNEFRQEKLSNPKLTTLPKAGNALTWLVRGLDFTCVALSQNLNNATEELSVSFRTAYGSTLKKHHSVFVKPVFSAAMSAVPYRAKFYSELSKDQSKLAEDMRKDLAALENIVGILKGFLETIPAKV